MAVGRGVDSIVTYLHSHKQHLCHTGSDHASVGAIIRPRYALAHTARKAPLPRPIHTPPSRPDPEHTGNAP